MSTTQLIDDSREAPFAPAAGIPRALELSIFYPAANTTTTNTTYIPPSTAAEVSSDYNSIGLELTAAILEQFTIPLVPHDTDIASLPNGTAWPTLLFSPAFYTTRLFYPSLLREIASHGFVIIAFDTAYDTSVLTLANGTAIYGNSSDYLTSDSGLDTMVTARAQDASFILDHLVSNITPLIPGCDAKCLNTTHVGMFGHSIGGASAATAMSRDARIIGAANLDGALVGNVTEVGLDHPYLVFATETQGHNSSIVQTALKSWAEIWPKIDAPKWWLLLNDSLHYTFSDLPLIVQESGLMPNQTVMNGSAITEMDAGRSEKVISFYTAAFFEFVFGEGMGRVLWGESKLYPEVRFDSVFLGIGNGTSAANETGMDGPDARFENNSTSSSGAAVSRGPVVEVFLAALLICWLS